MGFMGSGNDDDSEAERPEIKGTAAETGEIPRVSGDKGLAHPSTGDHTSLARRHVGNYFHTVLHSPTPPLGQWGWQMPK